MIYDKFIAIVVLTNTLTSLFKILTIKENLEVKYKKLANFVIIAVFLLEAVIIYYLNITVGVAKASTLQIFVHNIPNFILIILLSNLNFFATTFIYCFVYLFMNSLNLLYFILSKGLASSNYYAYSILRIVLCGLLPYLLARFFFSKKVRKVLQIKTNQWINLSVVACLMMLTTYFINSFPSPIVTRPGAAFEVSIISLIMLLVFIIIINLLKTIQENNTVVNDNLVLQEKLKYSKQKKTQDKLFVETVMEYYQKISSLNHDIRKHFAVLKVMNQNGKQKEIDNYINQIIDDFPTSSTFMFCENSEINALLTFYATQFKQANISYTFKALLPKDLGINISDLAILIGNSLENAQEASLQIPPSERYIELKAILKADALSLQVSNTFNGEIHKDKEMFISSKRKDKQLGLGTIIIKNTVNQYNGWCEFTNTDKVFTLNIHLNSLNS